MNHLKLAKTHTHHFINQFLTDDHLHGLSQGVSTAYKAVDVLFKDSPSLGAFFIGEDLRPHLLRVFAEYEIKKFSDQTEGFHHEICHNEAKNCQHLRVHKDGLVLTASYMGTRCERPTARKVIAKSYLAERNRDLFEDEVSEQNIYANVAYAQIMHGGYDRLENIIINVPSHDQKQILGTLSLSVLNPNTTDVEELIEETPYALKEQIDQIKNGKKYNS